MRKDLRTVANELRVTDYTVNDIFVNYLEDNFYVNRRYQRKLVWKLDEKRLLIDSILKGIPLPAVLIAQYKLSETNKTVLEIVDGMQRLNAIVSFLMGDFGIEYEGQICYFDPNAYAETFQLLNEGKLHVHTHLLPKELCIKFYRYQVPAIITGQDNDTIELIFTRINSTGRKISSHDLRQSTAVGEFPDLVRRIASHIRKDYTYEDRINLADMPKISVGPARNGFGVDIDTVFWRRHDLITAQNMAESKDEEIIESLVASVLLDRGCRKSKIYLDRLYEKGSQLNSEIELKIVEQGKDALEKSFTRIFDIFDRIFETVDADFSSYLFADKRSSGKDECFRVLFLALYQLVKDAYIITDYRMVAEAIKDAEAVLTSFIRQGPN